MINGAWTGIQCAGECSHGASARAGYDHGTAIVREPR